MNFKDDTPCAEPIQEPVLNRAARRHPDAPPGARPAKKSCAEKTPRKAPAKKPKSGEISADTVQEELSKAAQCTKSDIVAALMWAVEAMKCETKPGASALAIAFADAMRISTMDGGFDKNDASVSTARRVGTFAALDLADARTALELYKGEKTLAARCDDLMDFFSRETGRGKEIKDALLAQLDERGMRTSYTEDLVKTYMDMWALCELASADIGEHGITITYNNGGGQQGSKPNPSCDQLVKTNKQMLSILDKLGIVIPAAPPSTGKKDDDDP